MPHKFRIAYFAHAIRSDWNNGNAHFLRGLLRSLGELGHEVSIFEPEDGWSISNLRTEAHGEESLRSFDLAYPELRVIPYRSELITDQHQLRANLRSVDIVILHEWNPPALAHRLLELRDEAGFRLVFHDTHHRASSSPEQMRIYGIDRFDGAVVFGQALRDIYRQQFSIARVWTLHEAADVAVFRPQRKGTIKNDVIWIGNWGDEERSKEIYEYLLEPAKELAGRSFTVFGVRYPPEAICALQKARVRYGGYLANLDAPATYGSARLTTHIPRRQYSSAMRGIPTIRVFEALACGIPLVSAPWEDSEHLFRADDFRTVRNSTEMKAALLGLLADPRAAEQQAARGLETVQARHTCRHRAEELTGICEELVQ
ncbi:MAG TPA: glycosyltransferase [Terracidiphilus sp.]|nr:glycosyltransferase [Terracidiphilus sp.]